MLKGNTKMKKIISALLTTAVVLAAAVQVSAITKSDEPITGGNTVFTQKEFMYTGEPDAASPWSNAFCNEDWTGCRWTAETKDGVDCIKVVPVSGSSQNYMDFNYYQWNNDKYYPSLDCSEYRYFKVRYMLNDKAAETAGKSTFWASLDSPVLSQTLAAGSLDYDMPEAKPGEWQEVIVDLSSLQMGDYVWTDSTIRQFRYYPFGSTPAEDGAECCSEYMAFFKTESEAESYKGPNAVADTTEADPTASAETADMSAVVVLAASASLGLALALRKKH